jgi:hypothetical protein
MSDEVQRVQERVAYAEQRVADMQQCATELKGIQDKYQSFLWHRNAHSGPQLFTAICLLERETEKAAEWLSKEKVNLYWAKERAEGRIK